MRSHRFLLFILVLSVATIFSGAFSVSAQDNSALITEAVRDIGVNCANLALNTTCLGHVSVQRTTSSGLVSTTYTQPGDRASINTTHQVQTGAINPTSAEFGINVMRVQAGLSSGSQGVVYTAFDGTTLTNVGGAGQAVWQNISLSIAANSALPFLFVQGPKNEVVTITVNGKAIEIHSTVLIWFTQGEFHVTVVSGSIVSDGFTVNVCETITAPIVDGVVGTFGPPVAGLFPSGIAYIGLLPSNVINYPVGAPTLTTPSGVGGALPTCSIS